VGGTHVPTSVEARKSSTGWLYLLRPVGPASKTGSSPSQPPSTLLARRHIATLWRARRQITIEIRWCPARNGVPGNEKADEWATLAVETPDARGVEPLPRSLALLKREISEKKWSEARQWTGSRINNVKYKMPDRQNPDGVVAYSSKGHASRFYQLKTGHFFTGQHLHRTKSRPTPQCWWCASETQTRDHLFKECAEWKGNT
jgi:hypothetical protein